jgi:hypothetical protein
MALLTKVSVDFVALGASTPTQPFSSLVVRFKRMAEI